MKFFKILTFVLCIVFFSCKKNTLVEVVDVPSVPIEAVEVEGGSSKVSEVKANEGSFKMIGLAYEYKDLEPYFDAATTEIHYSRHHLGYVNNLNKLIIDKKYEVMSLSDIFRNLNASDTDIRNNAGGYYNHNFFWENISPKGGAEPEGDIMGAIIRDFGSFDAFRSQFVTISAQYFGSGWSWLISDKTGKLRIITTPNNDNPLMRTLNINGIPLLNLDLWEHAYYLKFQNKRREYANTFFSIINWKNVSKKYDEIPNKIEIKVIDSAVSLGSDSLVKPKKEVITVKKPEITPKKVEVKTEEKPKPEDKKEVPEKKYPGKEEESEFE
ncbi:superoxide dismutase [Flavobacterium sp.]|uniref:superoxide dismutase n=1 Tax=Flavobacterium sp. TaxID=239 RepID=UPI00286E3EDC|nr:superoxide dismutase [Flavobacterium sp.]